MTVQTPPSRREAFQSLFFDSGRHALMDLFHQTPLTCTPLFHIKNPSTTNCFINNRSNLSLKPIKLSLKPSSSIKLTKQISSLDSIKPYVASEWRQILKGWFCSAISVYSLSKIVPRIGQFTSVLSRVDAVRLREEGLAIGVLFSVQVVANYLQQAFLWEAALNCVYTVRVHVFERVLHRDLVFFESGNGVPSGDIAYRITAEASEVADTVYALLNTTVPSTLQLLAMATQMLVSSPVLSIVSVLVIPSMALVITYLGEKLQKISKEGNISIAALSAYLNELTEGEETSLEFISDSFLRSISPIPQFELTVGEEESFLKFLSDNFLRSISPMPQFEARGKEKAFVKFETVKPMVSVS